MEFEEKTLKENYLYKGKILNVRKDEIALPDGAPAIREVIEHSGGSAIYCERDNKVLLVKQFRYPYKEILYEIPAGKLNQGEEPETTALRELEEEGGVKAERVEKLFDVYPSPSYTDEVIRIYRAIGITDSVQRLDKDEFLTGEWFDKKTLVKMINKGVIKDGKTLIALLKML